MVSKILQARQRKSIWEFQVSWEGFHELTWEDAQKLHSDVPDLVQAFVLSNANVCRKKALAKFLDFQELTSGLLRFDVTLKVSSNLLSVDECIQLSSPRSRKVPSLEPFDMSKGKGQDWKVSYTRISGFPSSQFQTWSLDHLVDLFGGHFLMRSNVHT
jgi:hypothetical protein